MKLASRGAGLGLMLGLFLGGEGCNTVATDPEPECEDDEDCGEKLVCSVLQGNICVPEEPPPLRALGFDIREGTDLRVELKGCDPEVSRDATSPLLLVRKQSAMIRSHDLSVSLSRSVNDCSECTGECDEQALTCVQPFEASFDLSMSSRLGLERLQVLQKLFTAMMEGEELAPVAITWPLYETDEDDAHGALALSVKPPAVEEGQVPTHATVHEVIAEGAEAEVDSQSTLRCHRGIVGGEGAVRTFLGTPVNDAKIDFTHADSIASASSVLGPARSCTADEECQPGWACGSEGSCGLDLAGTLAGTGTSVPEPPGGFGPAMVYTYCEAEIFSQDPLVRRFTVGVTPSPGSGLPTTSYTLEQEFPDPPSADFRNVAIDGTLCLPDWAPPQEIEFEVRGDPVPLIETELGAYACCSTECLPSLDPEDTPEPPPAVEVCRNFDKVRFETRWFNLDTDAWQEAGCTPTAQANDGSSGRYTRDVDCSEGPPCLVSLTAGGEDDESRSYTVTVTSPAGSVFRSQRRTLEIDSETSDLGVLTLEPRVLLRGEISCVSEYCSAEDALVAAERLRHESDEPDPPGPWFFQTRVDATGTFVLPVDPGVYVITAYPAIGQRGGPSPFQVVDLREGSEVVETEGGIPQATLAEPMELDDGILVQVQLREFDLTTAMTPLDMGSWEQQDGFGYDLNHPDTCYGEQQGRGCRIRRIRPTESPLSLLIGERFQFTARARGSDTCPSDMP